MATKRFLNIRSSFYVSRARPFGTVADNPQFIGIQSRFTNVLTFLNKDTSDSIPIYRVFEPSNGVGTSLDINVDKRRLRNMYRSMVCIGVMDKILYESQRQGRISFYMTGTGEEAIQIGSAEGLTPQDLIYAQYREAGVLFHRGFRVSEFVNQCYGNFEDEGKGRQMPVHYGSKKHNFVTISSPLTTQLPQAVGAAYAMKRRGKEESCVACYFGDGAASEGDAHAGFNFAATLDCPIIFICRNNGYAISTPTFQQYRGDGIAARGPAYGINTIRVDGNDVLAMLLATTEARKFCINENKPVLIEAMSYRVGHHSTSDDSKAYRPSDEIDLWNNETPTSKFRAYLQNLGYWSEEEESELLSSAKNEVLRAVAEAEKKLKPHWKELFSDVYLQMPNNIKKQVQSMENHLEEYKEHYPLKDHTDCQSMKNIN